MQQDAAGVVISRLKSLANRVQIFTALELERRAVADALARADLSRNADITLIGIRAVRLPRSLAAGADVVLLAGLAGGLDPALRAGDVVIDCNDMAASVLAAPEAFPIRSGRIVTSPHPVDTPAAKSNLFRQGAIAVDMEGDAVRALAAENRAAFIHVRAISDPVDVSLDPRLLSLVDDVGRPRPWPLAGYLLQDPRRIGGLRRLGAATRLAAANLGASIVRVLRTIAHE